MDTRVRLLERGENNDGHDVVLFAAIVGAATQLGNRGRITTGVGVDQFMASLFLEGRGPESWSLGKDGGQPPYSNTWDRRMGAQLSYGGTVNAEASTSIDDYKDWEFAFGVNAGKLIYQAAGGPERDALRKRNRAKSDELEQQERASDQLARVTPPTEKEAQQA